MQTPRILMLSDTYFPRVNGVSTSIQTFRRDLERLGCMSVLVAPEYPLARLDERGVVRIRSRRIPLDPEDRMIVARELERAVLALGQDFDLVHVHTPFVAHGAGVRLARRFGVPIVETYHTFFEEYFHHYLPFVPRALLRNLARVIARRQCNAVDAVIAPSPQMAETLLDYGVQTGIHVIPTGLDVRTFERGDGAKFRTRYGIDSGRPVALVVGRVAFEKNLEFLISVIDRVRRSLPEVLLVIAGEGPALPVLRRVVARHGLAANVLFVGYLDRNGPLQDCFRSADAFVFASRTETQGLVLLEAMAQGIPVVSTAVLGTKSVLKNAHGAIVVDEDLVSFADALETVLGDRELQANLGRQARSFVGSNWSSWKMAERLLVLYQNVTRRSPAGTSALESAA